jgi:hypothetical protein
MFQMPQSQSQDMRGYPADVKATAWYGVMVIRKRHQSGWGMRF